MGLGGYPFETGARGLAPIDVGASAGGLRGEPLRYALANVDDGRYDSAARSHRGSDEQTDHRDEERVLDHVLARFVSQPTHGRIMHLLVPQISRRIPFAEFLAYCEYYRVADSALLRGMPVSNTASAT